MATMSFKSEENTPQVHREAKSDKSSPGVFFAFEFVGMANNFDTVGYIHRNSCLWTFKYLC